jgi:hypothetical protein
MLHTLRFSTQNAVYFIMLPFFGSCIIYILHIYGVLKFKCKTPLPKSKGFVTRAATAKLEDQPLSGSSESLLLTFTANHKGI